MRVKVTNSEIILPASRCHPLAVHVVEVKDAIPFLQSFFLITPDGNILALPDLQRGQDNLITKTKA